MIVSDIRADDTLLHPLEFVAAAARCWRTARDKGGPVQQRLHALLAPLRGSMAVPALDSLMALCEMALGRRLIVGTTASLTGDEQLLLGLLDGSVIRSIRIPRTDAAGAMLDCAICTTRIMLEMTPGLSPRRTFPL